jgi:hypothetical protein
MAPDTTGGPGAAARLRLHVAFEQYEHTLSRGLLAICLAVIASEAALEALDDHTHRAGAGAALFVALSWFVVFDHAPRAAAQAPHKREDAAREAVPKAEALPAAATAETRPSAGAGASAGETPSAALVAASTPATVAAPRSMTASGSSSRLPVFKTTVDGWVIKSDKEAEQVRELRRRLADLATTCRERPLNLSDPELIRFVRARPNLDQSEELFRLSASWRKEKKPEEIFEHFDPSPIVKRYMTGGWGGFDKEGSILFFDRIGQLDVPGMVDYVNTEEFLNVVIWRQEMHTRKMLESEQKFGKVQYQLTLVQDLKGLSWSHMHKVAIDMLKKAAYIDDHMYPERLKVAFIVNAPWAFTGIWNIVKYFFHANTRAKINISSDKATEVLLDRIDFESLPGYLGGGLKDANGDPECSAFIGKGGPVDKEFKASLTKVR